ncbi:uncharacterized protein ppp1r3ab [Notothenia coriiceps]|uniref:Uncharacterized protein ppp1r3ab n=1 Tax=Notothenia coriiceps TaxID=8208 RepID=A0A6I9N0N9_9TELE|nr:PREDICTED: protein phosphatase 1 regulatory subunit 3A [Notothenia coriiceps]
MSVARSRSSSLPTNSPTESPMEIVGQPGPSRACSLLGVPLLGCWDMDEDNCEVLIGIRPKSSPVPRRRSSVEEDEEPETPLSSSRRVSFADGKGLSLVQVKEFDTWDVPKLPECNLSVGNAKDAVEYFLFPATFSLPLSTEELFLKVQTQKVELENIELVPGTTILKGVVRVLNVSYNKAVYIRTSLDSWSSHFDLLAEYMPGSSDSLMDLFSFRLTLVPPFGEQGARVDFCLRYETPLGTFWANNNHRNYVLSCHQRMEERKEKPQKENVKKSCLKTVSQSFSTVENMSATEAPSQENISSDVSKHTEQADTMKAKQISTNQSATSEENQQKLLAESKQASSQRNRRKAARMAWLKDYFSQENGGADDTERGESPPEAKQPAQEESPEEKRADVRYFPEESSQSEGSYFVSESLETCSAPLLDVSHDTSTTRHYVSNSETAKSESVTAEHISLNPLHPNGEPAPDECRNINKCVSKAEEGHFAVKPADSIILEVSIESIESLVSDANSFTFGNVVAPLYNQVLGRVGSESDRGNPVRATLNVGDLPQSNCHSEGRQTSCTGHDDKLQGDVIKYQKSKQECLGAPPKSPQIEEKESCLIDTVNNIQHHVETQDDVIHLDQRCTITSEVPKNIAEDVVVDPHSANVSITHLLQTQTPTEDNLTQDLEDHTCAQTKTTLSETLTESETHKAMAKLETSFMSPLTYQSESDCVSDEEDTQTSSIGENGCKCVEESNVDNVDKTGIMSTPNGLLEENKLLEALHNLNSKHINNSAKKETEEKDTLISIETDKSNSHIDGSKHSAEVKVIGEVAESAAKPRITNHIHSDVLKDSQKIEHREIVNAVPKRGDFCIADTTEVNWEMMVEEEENSMLTDEEESEVICLKAVEKHQGELEDTFREAASEIRDTTQTDDQKMEITTAIDEENKAEVADELEGNNGVIEEDIGEILAGRHREEVEEELEYVREPPEEIEGEKKDEQEEIELEIQEVNIETTNILKEEEEMTNEVKSREGDGEQEDPDWEGESDIMLPEIIEDNEAGGFEEKVDFTQNKDGLSALVNNEHNKRVTDKENGHIPNEMQETDFQSSARDDNESTAAEEGSCISAEEAEIDSESAESDSDDEVELYMHCLRAVHTGAQSKDAGYVQGLRSYVSKGKLLSTRMPSISESLDEEQHLGGLQDSHEETADFQPTALPATTGQGSLNRHVSWWRETFSCSNISKTLIYATLLVVFLAVVQRYDFLACFGLYLGSVVWLYHQAARTTTTTTTTTTT